MNYKVPNNLLSTTNAKTIKGEKLGYTTYIMYLAPHTQNSKGINLCSHASKGCAKACLFGSGAARFEEVQNGKRNKTEYYLENRKDFMKQLVKEITKAEKIHNAIVGEKQYKKNGVDVLRFKSFAIRLNGTADIPFEKIKLDSGLNIFETFPNVQFYDYTKNPKRFEKKQSANYHLTFSRSEDNDIISEDLLSKGHNVAIVFGVKNATELPTTYKGYKVINGDETDLRFLDESNVVVGLKYKLVTGKGTKGQNKDNIDNNSFLIKVSEL
tara:strand:- start:1182 stop:1988 length:807 start_codon:yes stop_codon:yes gene_type:complete